MTTVVLVQAKPRIAATGATVDVRVAGGGLRAYDQLGFGDWRGGVATVPRMSAAIGFDAGGFTSRTLPSTASLRIFPSDKTYASYLGGLVWDKAAITVRMGDDATATTYPVVLAGTVSSAVSEGGAITLTVSDLSVSLDTPIASKTFAGTGDLEGGDDASGRVKRVAFGRVFNVEGFLLDKANSIYEFGDPTAPNAVTTIDAVRDKGLAGPLASVPWQGSAAATLTALRNATAPQGGAVVAPSIACVKWWTTPVGPLTADLTGSYANNLSPADLAALIAGRYATGITVANLSEATGWANYVSGILISDSNETAAQAIDRLLNPLLMAWTVDGAGALTFRRFNLDTPTATLTADTIKREVMFPPLRTRRVGFQRNNRIHSPSEISAAILATDVLFPDGTTGADLKITVGNILSTIDAIVSDGILSRGEKPPEIIRWQQSHDQLNALNQKYVTLGSPSDLTATRDSANAAVSALDTYLGSLSPAWNDTTVDTPIDGPTYRQKWRDALSALEGFTAAITGRKGDPGQNAPLLKVQWSINGIDNWHDNFFGADAYQRQSNDGGASYGPAYRVVGEGGTPGPDGTSPSIVFLRSTTVPPTPADNTGNPPTSWADGPPPGTAYLWQSKATFRGAQQLTSWSPPQRISGDRGGSAFTLQDLQYCYEPEPTAAIKRGGGSAWNAKAMIREGGQSVTVSGLLMPGTFIALTTDPSADASYESLDYAIHWSDDTGLFLFRNNAAVRFANRALDAGPVRVTIQKKADTISYLVEGYGSPAAHPANAPGEIVYATFAIYRVGDAVRGITYSIDGDKGDKGDKGDSIKGDTGPPPFGFVQDDNPGPGQFDRQTWYRPTSKEYYYWLNGAWNKVGGDLFSQNLITSSAQIADAIIINAKIGNLEVDTIKVKNNAITGTVGQTNGSATFSTQSVQFASVGITLYGGGMVRVDVGGIVTLGSLAPAGTQALLTVAAGQTVLASGVKVSGQRGSPIGFSFLVARQDLGAGPLTFTASIGANNGYGSGDPHLIEYGTIFVSEFKK